MQNMTPATEQRPTIVAILACDDHGPCDDGPTAVCPHCGADGRYVYTCLMSDGSRKGMMSGCLQTFRKDACARACEIALEKDAHSKASRWDIRILDAITALNGGGDILLLRRVCDEVTREKKAWMQKKGWRR